VSGMWMCHGGGYEDYIILGRDAVLFSQ